MTLANILMIASILTALISIPFLVIGPFTDYVPTGRVLLGLDEDEVNQIPSKFSKTLAFDRFEKTYETAFGKFYILMSAGKIDQELTRPDRTVKVTEVPGEKIWKLITQAYTLTVTQTPGKTVEELSSPDGSLIRTKEHGGVTETFTGFNPVILSETLSGAKTILEDEVEVIEKIKSETILPSLGGLDETPSPVVINEFEQNPEGTDTGNEWIELYNPSTVAVDVSGWTLTDSSGDVVTIDAGTSIGPNDYYVVDGSSYSLSLKNDGESLTLTSPEGVIDVTPVLADDDDDDNCWARVPNGEDTDSIGDWVFRDCTGGNSND